MPENNTAAEDASDTLDMLRSMLKEPDIDDATFVLRKVYKMLNITMPDFLTPYDELFGKGATR